MQIYSLQNKSLFESNWQFYLEDSREGHILVIDHLSMGKGFYYFVGFKVSYLQHTFDLSFLHQPID